MMMMMQPPPRKVNESQQVKQVFSEQISKLQNKQQQDTDLLEEIRSFSKHRAAIEKDYGQALQRLAVQYQKRDWQRGNTDAINAGSVFSIWRSVVDATAQSAASRLAAAEEYRALISQASRSLRDAKELRAKKGLECLQRAQGEVLEVLRELHRVKKSYHQLSHICTTARDKAADAHARAKKSDHGIFHFRSGLHKFSSNWLDTRLKECDDRLTAVRNEYLLSLAAINSHHHYYYNTDLKHVMENMDGDVYEQLRAHFTQLCETEASVCLSIQRQYRHIGDTAAKVTRERNVVQFFQESVSFNKTPEICFHPAPQDKVCVLQEVCSAPGGEGSLDSEARKWASKAAKDYKIISHGERALPTLESRVKLLSGETGLSMERKISEVQESVRKAKVSRVRAEARLALLSQSGVGAEQCLRAAMSHAQEELERERRLSQQRRATDDFSEEDEFELTDLEDYADDSGDIFVDPSSSSTPGVYVYPAPCRVIYNYQASQSDELSITEGEELQVVEDGDVEDWLKVGYVPERYVQFLCVPLEGAATQLDGSFSSGSSSSAGHMTRTKRTGVARALYTYQAQSPDELSFNEGAIIHLLRCRRGQVDDGYWEGELDGRMGVFPSLVVERLLVETQEEEEEAAAGEEEEEEEEETLITPTLPSFSPPIPISTPNAGYCSAHSTPPPPSGVEDALQAVSGEQHRLVTDSRAESAGSEHSSPDLSNRQLRPCRAPPPPPTQRFFPVQ